MASVSLKNVVKRFGPVVAVDHVSLEIGTHEFVVLVGPSGCGKSTTLRMLAGLESISDGHIHIDDRIVNQIIAVMLFADSEDDKKAQYLYINTPGGSVTAGLALYDTMGHVSSDVITCNVGMAASMGSFILGAGQRGKRIALPHSKTMIHQPMGGARGQAEDIRIQAEQIMKIKASLVDEYAMMTGQTRERIEADLDRDNYMSAQQALEYGLIDKIVTSVDGP